MTTTIQYHAKTTDIAILESSGDYWIGSYCPHLTHQNGEPPFVWLSGHPTLKDAQQKLATMTGNEF